MDWRVLGPLEVVRDDGCLAEVAPRERELVAVLLVSAGTRASRPSLVRALWGQTPPADSAGQLRVVLSRARRALGRPGGSCLRTVPDGYHLAIAPATETDLGRFRDHRAHGLRLAQAGKLPDASTALEKALACWRDPALTDLPDTPELAPEQNRLLAERRDTALDLTDVLLALGQHHRVVADLHGQVIRDPLCERTWRQVILALYQCGRKSDALRFSTDATAALRRRGKVPGPELKAMLEGILTNWRDTGGEPPLPRLTALTGSAGMDRAAS